MSGPSHETGDASSRSGLRACLAMTLGVKILLLATGWLVAETRLDATFREPGRLFGLFHRWDSAHYLAIAESGYAPPPSPLLAFPPALPLLIRGVSALSGSVESAAVLVSTLLSFLPPLLLFLLVRLDGGTTDTGVDAVRALLLFPTALFLHVAYTESLFLTLVLGAFVAARTGRWGLCALAGALTGFTRINGFVLIPALALEAWPGPRKGRTLRLAAAAAPCLGVALYMAITASVAGDPLAFMSVQRQHFHRHFAMPWEGVANLLVGARIGGGDAMMVGVLQLAFIPMMLAAIAAASRSGRPSYVAWTVGNVLVFTAQGFWISVPRLVLVLFPFFIRLPLRLEDPLVRSLWFAGSTLLLGFLTAQFATGWWVS